MKRTTIEAKGSAREDGKMTVRELRQLLARVDGADDALITARVSLGKSHLKSVSVVIEESDA